MTFYFSEHKREGMTKAGAPSVAFNVVLMTDLGTFAFTGWRLIKGRLVPPAVKVQRGPNIRYIDTVLMDDGLVRQMVQALRAQGFPVAETDDAALGGVLTQERMERVLS